MLSIYQKLSFIFITYSTLGGMEKEVTVLDDGKDPEVKAARIEQAKKDFLDLNISGKLRLRTPDEECFLNPSSCYINRWGFQRLAQHVYDPRTAEIDEVNQLLYPTVPGKGITFDPAKVEPGDIIFVRNIPKFFEDLFPGIKVPIVIITGGDSGGERTDYMADEYVQYLNIDAVRRWFGIHASNETITCSNFTPIPLGVWQGHTNYHAREQMRLLFKKLRETTNKEWLLYLNAGDFNDERKEVRHLFNDATYCVYSSSVPHETYLTELAQSVFVLDVRGYGIDCYRRWEALLVGTIPIVTESPLNPLYEDLPIVVIKDWKTVTPQFLLTQYEALSKREYDLEKLFMKYWENLIISTSKSIKEEGWTYDLSSNQWKNQHKDS